MKILICNSKVVQVGLEAILGGQAGVHQEALFPIPFLKASIVEQLKIVLNDKGNDVVLQAFLKEDQAAYTAISVLEGMCRNNR